MGHEVGYRLNSLAFLVVLLGCYRYHQADKSLVSASKDVLRLEGQLREKENEVEVKTALIGWGRQNVGVV